MDAVLLRPRRVARGIAVAAIALVAILPGNPTVAESLVTTSAITDVQAFGSGAALATVSATVYVASSSGLYRSASPTFLTWLRQSTHPNITALSPNPRQPDDLLFSAGYPNDGLYRSTDGGRTAARVANAVTDIVRNSNSPYVVTDLERSSVAPSIVYATTQSGGGEYDIFKSVDDGISWTTVLTGSNGYYEDYEGFGPIAVDPYNPDHVVVGFRDAHAYGGLYASYDGGRTWPQRQNQPFEHVPMTAIGFNPLRSSDLWVAWGQSYGGALFHHGVPVTAKQLQPSLIPPQSVSAIQFDPLTGRVYVDANAYDTDLRALPSHIYASGDGGAHFEPLASGTQGFGSRMAITSNGYVLTGGYKTPLVVRPLIGSGNWAVAPALAPYYASTGAPVLGGPLSPLTWCQGALCQYFDKGALETRAQGVYAYVALAPRLLGTRSPLPVGASVSSVTYGTLYSLHGRQIAPPPGFQHGTMPVRGGIFVPSSPTLAPAPGYLVPPYFWSYLTNPRTAPGGWLRAVGLPLTNATAAMVRKGTLGTRSIMMQAFQDAVLTYDPRNAAPFRVERANIGADYARLFPQAVR